MSFDLDVIKQFKCHAHGSDPAPKSNEFLKNQTLPDSFHAYEYAVADYDGELELICPKNQNHVSLVSGDDGTRDGRSQIFKCLTIKSFMNRLNHQHIDLLKMDIKGPEFGIIRQLIEDKVSFNQIVVEFTPELF